MAVPDLRNASPHARPLLEAPASAILPIAPNFKFELVFYPNHEGNWFVGQIEPDPEIVAAGKEDPDAGLWWLPVLQKVHAKPGVCGFRTIRRGASTTIAGENSRLKIERYGGIRLDPAKVGQYVQPFDCKEPGTGREGVFYAEVWDSPRKVLTGRKQKFECDRQRRYRWLLWLMREGHIPEPPDEVIEIHRDRRAARIARRETITGLTDSARDQHVAAAAADLAKIDGARVPDLQPASRPRGRKPRGEA